MRIKRLLASVITLSLIVGMFTCVPVHAAGASEEVFNIDFEGTARLPQVTYNGATYNTSGEGSYTNYSSVQRNGFGGRTIADQAIYINASAAASANSYFDLPAISALQDIGGGSVVLSWDVAIEDLTGSNNDFWVLVNVSKKKTSDGTLENQQIQFTAGATKLEINMNNGHANRYQSLNNYVQTFGKWYRYDLVLSYGTQRIQLYQNGVSIYNYNDNRTVLSGYTIAGIGSSTSNIAKYRLRCSSSGNKKVYLDNIRVRRYDDTETFYPGYSEEFSSSRISALASASSGSWFASDSSSATFTAEAGVYGKAATDTSVKITKNTDVASGSKGMYYRHTGTTANYQPGGKVHISFGMAFNDKNKLGFQFSKFFQFQPSGGTSQEVFTLNPGKLRYGDNAINVGWEGGKWYKFDVYITPGDGSTVKNKADLYMNGRLMFQNYELADYSFTQIADIRVGQREQVISGYHDNVTYIDDFSYDYTPAGVTPVYPSISLSSSNGSIKLVDTDTVYINGSATSGAVDSAVTVTGGTKYMISDTQTAAASGDNATDRYILVRAANNETYIYPIISGNIERYIEDFSSHTYSAGNEIRYWDNVTNNQYSNASIRGTRTPVTGLSGKAAADQSIEQTQGRTAHNISTDFVADSSLKLIVEFNLLMNDTAATEQFDYTYSYKDGSDNVTNVSLDTLLQLGGGNIYAFRTVNPSAIGTYEQNQWNKFVLEIDPTAFTADVYQNGTKIADDVAIASGNMSGNTITKLTRLKHMHTGTTDTTASKWSAIDDIKVYVGAYDPSQDTQTVTAPTYLVNSSINWIAVPAATTKSAFDSAVTLSNTSGQKTVFTDNTMATSSDSVAHNSYYAAETTGGAIHYYRIVDQTEKSIVTSKKTTYGGNAISVGDTLSTGNYTMNAVYEKYNNNPESVYVILGTYEVGSPETLKVANFTEQALSFGTGETATVTANLANASYKLRAMVWDTATYRPLCQMTEY